jgi:hypothetical protein
MVTVERKTETVGVQRRKFSKAEYYRMAELGFFNGQRVELIDGEVILMSPQEAGHATAVGLVADAFQAVFTEGFTVRVQQPLDLGETYEPEPMSPSSPDNAVTIPLPTLRRRFSSLKWLSHRLTTTAPSKAAFTLRRAFKSFGF